MCSLKIIFCIALLIYSFVMAYGQPITQQPFRSDYVKIGNNFYKYHNEERNWTEAISNCESEGAQLFYPENEEEAHEVAMALDIWNRTDNIIIGVSDLREDGIYESINGDPIATLYHKWTVHEPNSGPNNEYHCLIYWNHDALSVHLCGWKWSSICKFNPTSPNQTETEAPETTETVTAEKHNILCDGENCTISGNVTQNEEIQKNYDNDRITLEYAAPGTGILTKVFIPLKVSIQKFRFTSVSNSSTVNISLEIMPKNNLQ